MADNFITEARNWAASISRIETTTKWLGGEDGVANRQAKELAARTNYLKDLLENLQSDKQDQDPTLVAIAALATAADKFIYFTGEDQAALGTVTAFARSLLAGADAAAVRALLSAVSQAELNAAIAGLVNSSPATLDTLKELADALGDDPNFAVTMTNALAARVQIADLQKGTHITATAGGTADAITGIYTPGITELTNGMTLYVRAGSANATTTPTFSPASGTIPAKTIVKGAGAALVASDIAGVGHWIELKYDATLDKWVLLNPATGVSVQAAGNSMKNRVINGAIMVDQRNSGSAQTITAGSALAYTVDRWYAYCTGANITGQQVALANGHNRYKLTGAASNTGVGFGQRIEAKNCRDLAGQTATLQVKAASSSLTTLNWAAYYANTADSFGSLVSPTRTAIASGSFTISGTEATYTTQINVPAAAITGIEIVFTGGALAAAQTLQIGDVQLEAGSTASTFEARPYHVEINGCQRYYMRWDQQDNFLGSSSTVGASSRFWQTFPVQMRAAPSGNYSAASAFTVNDNASSQTSTAITMTQQTKNGVRFDVTHAALGTQKPVFAQLQASAWVDFSAEL